jgi:mono/diheme cytochrome c family protein
MIQISASGAGRFASVALMSGFLLACAPAAPPTPPPEPKVAIETPVVVPPVYRGGAIAQQVCVQCHDVDVEGLSATTEVGAPGFVEVANREGMTGEKLVQWLRTSHPLMPTFMFDDTSVEDLAVFIMSLRRPR